MFQWTDTMLRFMRDACEYTRFYDTLAAAIAPFLSPEAHVCDAGCGAGYLAAALLPYAGRVTAIDRSAEAIALLREKNTAAETVVGDVHALPPETPYDAMVCCFFGGTAEALALAQAQCGPAGRLFLIKKDWVSRRFTTQTENVERHSCHEAERELRALGVPYRLSRLELEMGQPFRSFDDALLFFREYNWGGGTIDPERIRARLRPDPSGQYAFYMPEKKNVGLFLIETEAIPREISR